MHGAHTHTLARSISISLSEETATSAKNEIGSAQVARRKGAVQREWAKGKGKGMEVWKMGKWETGSLKFMLFVKKMNFT